MSPETILESLVSYPSVVGAPNGAIVEYVRALFASHSVPVSIIPGPEGDRSNLFATVGPTDVPGYILSGHLDVVPAKEPQWLSDPFRLRRDGERLIGRGACDMKGFVAAILSAVPDLVDLQLPVPIHFALSYDEEAGGRGAPHMIRELPNLCAAPIGCIVGEPSNMVPILRHKGKMALRVVARGVSGHSSRTDLGSNAIHKLLPALATAVQMSDALKSGPLDPFFEPPYSTLQVGVIRGGEAINIIPGSAELHVEARAIAGVDPAQLLDPIRALAGQDMDVEVLSSYPPLAMTEDHPLAGLMESLSGQASLAAVSYGTEAGLFQAAGVPTVICGPGDISRAHKPEEFVTIDELHSARSLVLSLARHLTHER
ncbi:acetylornithine deacetylase [Mesorhizobium sp.]|uniref:acetylornithine deacetylase n=1 Tax=Mesorhizobium sp. TaxID=1871066 RepID=UPI0025F0183D|nr:acetylornithine deacetylase [Mesorhizobium sp.]